MKKVTIRLGESNTCLTAATVAALAEKKAKTETVVKILKTPYGCAEKKFVEVQFEGSNFYADYITGPLYEKETGKCLATSKMEILPDDYQLEP